ncbi:DUF2236-containing protein [Fragilaria crotonensis]|nr:DUF2236-containing protein [Fragilaria crotonensis]
MSQARQRDKPRYSLRSLLTFDSLNLHSLTVDPSNVTRTSQIINRYGQDVAFCSIKEGGRFLPSEELEPYRMVGDPPLDELMEFMDIEGWPLKPGDDLLERDKYPSHIQERIDELLNSHTTLPSWVDVEQLQRGQQVFLRYMPAATISLYYRSLNKLLSDSLTLELSWEPARPALTTSFLVGKVGKSVFTYEFCMPRSGDHCCGVQERELGKLQVGIPINQEDMATLLAFSINTLKGIEFLGGVDLPRREQEDYLALWRYIGWLMGVPTIHDPELPNGLRPLDPCGPGWIESNPDSVDHATALLQSMVLHLLIPDQSSVIVSHHLLKIGRPIRKKDGDLASKEEIAKQAASMYFWFHFRSLLCRSFIGDPLANALELPHHPRFLTRIFIYCGVRAYLWAFRCVTWAAFWEGGRTRMERYFSYILGKFHVVWTERHQSRMSLALQTKAPCCPFAMITHQ